MLLQMGQLSEALGADVALERPLPGVRPEVHLEVRQLPEGLAADVALVVHFPVLLLQRIGQRPVAPGPLRIRTERSALRAPVIVRGQRARGRVSVQRRGVRVNGQTRMVSEMKIVRASDQRLVPIDLHRRGGRKLVAARRGLQPSPVRPLVDHVSARGRRVGGAVDGQRGDVVMQGAVLVIDAAVRVGGGRLDRRDGRHALVAARRRARVHGTRVDLTTAGAGVQDRGGGGARGIRGRRWTLALPLRRTAAGRRRRMQSARGRQDRAGR